MLDSLENERLEALNRLEVLDTPPEPLFDSLTELAALSFQAPIALISLVDRGRQWFKSSVGWSLSQSSRADCFCRHTILTDDVMVIPDATKDRRFQHNPLVTGPPGVRFYAGAPLITSEGFRLGAVCVIDTAAREKLSETESARLQGIARSVVQALLLRQASQERERTAAVSAERNYLLGLAEQMAGVGTWSWDAATDTTAWSPEVYRIHGLPVGTLSPNLEGVLSSYHPKEAQILADLVDGAIRDGSEFELAARIFRPDGEVRNVIARGAGRRSGDGAIVGMLGTFVDVTEHVQAERFIRAVTDHLPGMVGYWDSQLRCRFANAAYRDWFGIDPATMVGQTLPELLGPKLFAENEPYIRAALRGETQNFQRTLVKPSGEIGHTLAHYIPDTAASGRVGGFYVLVTDVTALKETKAKLREANLLLEEACVRAEAATAAKSQFLANMSHEIRTPLTAILGFTGLLTARTDLPDTAISLIERVKGAGASLLSIVNDILDFSKLEAGEVKLDPRPVDVVSLAHEVLSMFEPQVATKSLSLVFEAGSAVPTRVMADSDRLRQILVNLISNAVKFTEQGEVRLQLGYDFAAETLTVRVEDTGVGMDEAQRALLFKRFSQVDGSSTRRHGGAGLGLAISKGLAEAMGGDIDVESTPGRGSVFQFSIKAPQTSALENADSQTEPLPSLEGVRVLLADDNPFNREIARSILQTLDAEVQDVADGAQLVRQAAEAPFDVILIDLHMPVLDGVGALERLRSEPGPNTHTPAFAFTADLPDTVDCGVGGFDGVITKPIMPSAMVAALVQATRQPGTDLPHERAAVAGS